MAYKRDNLDIYAQALGYPTEKEMFIGLYLEKKLTISAISKVIGCRSPENVRLRMLHFGIPLRERGGYNGRKPKQPTEKETTNDNDRSSD